MQDNVFLFASLFTSTIVSFENAEYAERFTRKLVDLQFLSFIAGQTFRKFVFIVTINLKEFALLQSLELARFMNILRKY